MVSYAILSIDGGSSMNIISKEVADKLQLPTEKRPKPCKVAWVDGRSMPINHRCLVLFKIGTYEDSV